MKLAIVAAALLLMGSPLQEAEKTFASPDGMFSIRYPESFTVYSGSDIKVDENGNQSLENPQAYIPECTGDSQRKLYGNTLIACFVFPKENFYGTNFGGAGLQISKIEAATSPKSCLTPPMQPDSTYPKFEISKTEPTRTVNGIRFVHGVTGGVAAGHSSSTNLYRTFHNGKCYELAINISQTSFAVYDPGTIVEFTKEDENTVRRTFEKIVESFRFLR